MNYSSVFSHKHASLPPQSPLTHGSPSQLRRNRTRTTYSPSTGRRSADRRSGNALRHAQSFTAHDRPSTYSEQRARSTEQRPMVIDTTITGSHHQQQRQSPDGQCSTTTTSLLPPLLTLTTSPPTTSTGKQSYKKRALQNCLDYWGLGF